MACAIMEWMRNLQSVRCGESVDVRGSVTSVVRTALARLREEHNPKGIGKKENPGNAGAEGDRENVAHVCGAHAQCD